MNLSTVFAKMTMLILIMLLGYLCARIGITGPEFNKRVTPLMARRRFRPSRSSIISSS